MSTSSPSGPPSAVATNNIDQQNSSVTTSTKMYKKHLSGDRIAAYLEHPLNSQVQHRHTSAEESVGVHTKAMKEKIDALMKELDG